MNHNINICYENAKTLVEGSLSKNLLLNDGVFAHWIGDSDIFWYQRDTPKGREFRLVDATASTNEIAFDHHKLAKLLEEVSGHSIDTKNLPIKIEEVSLSPFKMGFKAFNKSWIYDAFSVSCLNNYNEASGNSLLSPDGNKAVFVRDNNLWLSDLPNGKEYRLTIDGSNNYPYATAANYSGQSSTCAIQAVWSPDSSRLFTHQLDLRQVRTRRSFFPVASTDGVESEIHEFKSAYPGDEVIEAYRLLVINIDSTAIVEVDHHKVATCRGGFWGYFSDERFAWWSCDSRTAFFIDVERGAKNIQVLKLDTETGIVSPLFRESSDTFVRLSHSILEHPLCMPLPKTNELLWFSERDGWGHLYLYDLTNGELKYRITEGHFLVREILHFDAQRRDLIVKAAGRDRSVSPYYQDVCRINIDSGEVVSIATGNFEHIVFSPERLQTKVCTSFGLESEGVNGISPSGDFVVVTRSRVDTLPKSVLFDRDGNEVMQLETGVMVGLPNGWHWPKPIKVNSDNEELDLYGVMFFPPDFTSEHSYPVLDYCLTTPYASLMPQGSFVNDTHGGDTYLTAAAYAALGFVVVILDVPGTPYRSKAFQDESYGCMQSANAFDHRVRAFFQLAENYPFMDLSRVGIVGCDGVNGPVLGLLERPDFYKVGVNVAFDDPRYGLGSAVEMYEGITPPKKPYTQKMISKLQGKLLLIHGSRDLVVPQETTLQLADALQKANKDFDMILEPEGMHIVSSYALRRTWDYLTTHLLKLEPPKSFKVTTAYDRVFGATDSNEEQLTESDSVQESEEGSTC